MSELVDELERLSATKTSYGRDHLYAEMLTNLPEILSALRRVATLEAALDGLVGATGANGHRWSTLDGTSLVWTCHGVTVRVSEGR